jgi:diaminopimelate decarboxylase
VKPGDLLAVRTAGAYGSVMGSNYNGRARPAEVMVDGDRYYVIRERESLESLYASENRLPGEF